MNLDELNQRIKALGVGESLRLENVPDHVYHASEGFGSSKIKDFMKNPKFFQLISKEPKKQTPSMLIGSAFHCAVLEPGRFESDYTAESINKRTKAGKERAAEIEAEGITLLTTEQMAAVLAMRDSCLDQFSHYIKDGAAEVSHWRRWSSEIVCKARIDYEIGDLAVDLKSTVDVFGFERAAKSFRYDIQNVHYLWVTEGKLTQMLFLPTGNSAPYLSGTPVYYPEDWLESVFYRWKHSLRELEDSLLFGEFEGLPVTPKEIETKPWDLP